MMRRRESPSSPRFLALAVGALLLVGPAAALADAIDPERVDTEVVIGTTINIQKTVTVSAGPVPDAPVDVFFLFDTTGDMSPFLDTVKASASAVVAGVSGLGDLAFGVGAYQDFPVSPWGGPVDAPYLPVQGLSGSASDTLSAINGLTLGDGADRPEAQLTALSLVATTTSWRADSKRIVVWFGNAPGHDGALEPGYPGSSLGSAAGALLGEDVVVAAVDMDALDETGQATAIANATDGSLLNGPDPGDIVDAITEAVLSYKSVELEVVGADTDNTTVTITPGSYEGDFDRFAEREYLFDVAIRGDVLGIDEFEIHALVDGDVVAVETDRVEVIPEPGAMAIFGVGVLLVRGSIRRQRAA